MEWEYLGRQELRDSLDPGKGHVYVASMWRTPVPGGWLLMTVNQRTNDPQPTTSFYPDPAHAWQPHAPAEAATLLRPAIRNEPADAERLLRPRHDGEPATL